MNRNGKRKQRWMFLCLLAVVLYGIADDKVREKNRITYQEKIAFYEQCMETEKAWILMWQNPQGAIYLYELEENVSGTVNPYFACLAARGLLAGEPNKQQLEAVKTYLKWHTKALLQARGEICDYRVVEGKLIPTGDSDSVDAYLAVYLSLTAEYAQKGGNLAQIPNIEEAVELCVEWFKKLTAYGLTSVAKEKKIYYLMDNVEVLDAYQKMSQLFFDCEQVNDWEKKEEFQNYFSQAALETEAAIMRVFWSEQKHHFEIGVNDSFTYLNFRGMEYFYPEAIAQFYSEAFDIRLAEKEKLEPLYEEVTNLHDWNDKTAKDGLGWPVMAYIAVKMGDISGAETYVRQYYEVYENDRSYPFHTADAGWMARCCELLRNHYLDLSKRGLLENLAKKIMQCAVR